VAGESLWLMGYASGFVPEYLSVPRPSQCSLPASVPAAVSLWSDGCLAGFGRPRKVSGVQFLAIARLTS
jgi:hypothetical protein